MFSMILKNLQVTFYWWFKNWSSCRPAQLFILQIKERKNQKSKKEHSCHRWQICENFGSQTRKRGKSFSWESWISRLLLESKLCSSVTSLLKSDASGLDDWHSIYIDCCHKVNVHLYSTILGLLSFDFLQGLVRILESFRSLQNICKQKKQWK